ncbi:hypothetical protein JNUCC1_01485 [Lentibacillus sp. JNUCC-1]|uniref:hypothetical protein n=1 Tax=Lentibacillus sp. JNUCC-1 TaxID=2654513 RepID=UPI0012E80832|nr:hypothetical protein [Lentibacillus sp. JNUCC-1]MUV37679.1 hypothetical protein [Lentibacillus sp. JNUCC-1]
MRLWVLMFAALAFITAGCDAQQPTEEHVIIDWVDFVKLNDVQYEASHTSVITDPSFVGEKIGDVTFNVDDNISNTRYTIKNGDAAYLEKGTLVYQVNDMPGYAAVPDEYEISGYRLYSGGEAGENDMPQHFSDLTAESVKKIEVYMIEGKPKLVNTLSEEAGVSKFMSLLDSGESGSYTPDTSSGDPDRFALVFDYGEPIAYTSTIFYDGVKWYWHEQEMTLLPNDVKQYVQ